MVFIGVRKSPSALPLPIAAADVVAETVIVFVFCLVPFVSQFLSLAFFAQSLMTVLVSG